MLVTNLVKVKHPDATTVEGSGGRDWGIDTFAGQLARGDIRIWQSKFILEWKEKSSQDQVRDSFKSAVANANAKKHTIKRWTLVVPCILPPDQLRWFKGWAKREGKKAGIDIDIWDGTELRHQLILADAQDVRREYFAHTMPPGPAPARDAAPEHEPVHTTDDIAQFQGALFLRQLHEAGRTENDAACAMFYATEALLKDYTARGNDGAVASMDELHLEVQDIWERHYNNEAQSAGEDGRMPRLIDLVINEAAVCVNPPGLNLRPAHKKGTAHRLVEHSRAGWVAHWREVASEHALAAASTNTPAVEVEAETAKIPLSAAAEGASESGVTSEGAEVP